MNIGDLAKEINKTLEKYSNEVLEEMDKVAEKVAKDGVKTLRLRSPKDTGKYAKGWKTTKVNGKWIVHNRIYQLTHLLEKSHALVGGGRSKAQPHIGPVEQEIIKEYVKGVEEAIKG